MVDNVKGKINQAKESMSHAFKDVETANEHMLDRCVVVGGWVNV
jgi:hypothetical protein